MKNKIIIFVLFLSVLVVSPAWVEDEWKQSVDKMSSIISLIENSYYKEIDPETLSFSSIKGMLKTLDPHSYFLNPRRLTLMQEEYKGKYSGLGILIQKHETRLVVISPIEGTPAYRLGIRAGDVISHINGDSTEPITSFDAMLKLRGKKGTEVKITIVRESLDKPLELNIVRAEIPLYSVPYAFMLTDDIGYIFIRNFAETTTEEFEEKMDHLSDQGMQKLVLDFRGNGGGTFGQSVTLSDEFLSEGQMIVSIRGRDPYYNREFRARRNKQFEDIPLVLLINQGTASAPEIVGGAIRDNDRGLIIGEDSWGKGLVQTVFPLAANAAVALTTAKYYTPSGVSIQRDYSRYEDYYLYRPDVQEEAREIRYTSGGRKVMGQGGISPDYEVVSRLKPQTVELLFEGAFFRYGRKFKDKETPLARQYILPGEIDSAGSPPEEKILFDGTYSADSKLLEDFKLFLLDEKIDFDSARFAEAEEEIKRELERELYANIWDIQEGYHVYRKTDPVVMKAIEVMPEAENLINKK